MVAENRSLDAVAAIEQADSLAGTIVQNLGDLPGEWWFLPQLVTSQDIDSQLLRERGLLIHPLTRESIAALEGRADRNQFNHAVFED